MNLRKKIDYFKSFNLLMIINAVFILVGIVLAVTVGLNLPADYAGGGIFMFATLSGIFSILAMLFYTALRYGWAKAFALIFSAIINVLLLVSLVLIFRVPVADGLIMSILVVIVLTALNHLFLVADLDKNFITKNVNLSEKTNEIVKKNINKILLVYATALFLAIVMFVVPVSSALDLFRTLLLAVVVGFYSCTFLTLPLYWFVYKRIENVSKKKEKSTNN